jgi:hypothetical protein
MTTVKRLLAGTVAVAATSASTLVASTAPAQAHGSCDWLRTGGVDRARACVEVGHHTARVADLVCGDGEAHGTFVFLNGTRESIVDPCVGGSTTRTYERTIDYYHVCVEGIGCLPWKNA